MTDKNTGSGQTCSCVKKIEIDNNCEFLDISADINSGTLKITVNYIDKAMENRAALLEMVSRSAE